MGSIKWLVDAAVYTDAGEIGIGLLSAVLFAAMVLAEAQKFYGRLPAHWLCDYDEVPWEMHMPGFRGGYGRKSEINNRSIFYVAVWFLLAVVFVKLFESVETAGYLCNAVDIMCLVLSALATVTICVLAVIIMFSDLDYMIIPDQMVAGIGIGAVVLAMTDSSFAELFAGSVTGAGLMLFTGFAGVLTGNGFSAGFGDVKLMAVCGAVAGKNALLMYVVMALGSGIYFCFMMIVNWFRYGESQPAVGKVRYGQVQPLAPWICGAMLLCM